MVREAGAAGALTAVFVSLNAFVALDPQPLYANTRMLSVGNAAAFDTHFNRITLDVETSPESTVTPETPPTDEGIDHK